MVGVRVVGVWARWAGAWGCVYGRGWP